MGPTCSILLPYSPDEHERVELEAVVKSLDPSALSAEDFHVETTLPIAGTSTSREGGRPFSVRFAESVEAEAEEEESLRQIEDGFSFWPIAEIQAAAGCNEGIDHRILGELAAFLSNHFGGIINFGGQLGVDHADAGKLQSVRYAPASGGQAIFHVGDLAFLKQWLNHPRFHMCK
jgi:hypothetical protein